MVAVLQLQPPTFAEGGAAVQPVLRAVHQAPRPHAAPGGGLREGSRPCQVVTGANSDADHRWVVAVALKRRRSPVTSTSFHSLSCKLYNDRSLIRRDMTHST